MGLLEKAYEYKKEINRKGQATLIDTIEGPAETGMMDESQNNASGKDDNQDIDFTPEDDQDNEDLFQLPEEDNYSPLDALNEQKAKLELGEEIPKDEPNMQEANFNKIRPTVNPASNPLTVEDEPMMPADIDVSYSGTEDDNLIDEIPNMKMNKFEIPEIEPDIIEDEHPQNGNGMTNNQEDIETDAYPFSEAEAEVKTSQPESSEANPVVDEKYQTQYEIKKEISKSETKKTLFEIVIFSVMGQIVTSSVSILIRNPDNNWIIADSNKPKSEEKSVVFNSDSGIMQFLKKDIIDIEKYKNNPECSKQYNDLNSINVRLLFPWTYKNEILGTLALGNKITDEDYTEEEKDTILSICEAAAIELKKLDTIEKLKKDIGKVQSDLHFNQQLNSILEKIYSANNLKNIKNIIKTEFDEIGIKVYSVFIKDSNKEKYISMINGNESVLPEDEKSYPVKESNPFISLIKTRKASPRIEDYNNSEIVKKAFTESQINKMSVLWVYPFEIGGVLTGFLTIFKVSENLLNQENKTKIDEKLNRLSATLISAIHNVMRTDPERNRYVDYVESILLKIKKELVKSKELNIPITLVVFSIKNYKRYENLFGFEKSEELINNFSHLVISRLSETDFSFRYDRNKILILLPGKDKKFGSAFANTVRNEFMQMFKNNEIQLLVTFLLSESPADGDDLSSFTINID